VAQHFALRDIENFLPLYSEVHHWTNRRKTSVELPLFPNYLFVRISRSERTPVLRVPGVLSLVGGAQPAELAEFEIESLRSGLRHCKVEPHAYLVVGDRVRIKAGPLCGMQGILVRKKTSLRVVLSVAEIGRSLAVEVDVADIEHIAATRTMPSSERSRIAV
jgi:transcription antitermination factor NusG